MEDKCVKGLNPATYCDIRLDFTLPTAILG